MYIVHVHCSIYHSTIFTPTTATSLAKLFPLAAMAAAARVPSYINAHASYVHCLIPNVIVKIDYARTAHMQYARSAMSARPQCGRKYSLLVILIGEMTTTLYPYMPYVYPNSNPYQCTDRLSLFRAYFPCRWFSAYLIFDMCSPFTVRRSSTVCKHSQHSHTLRTSEKIKWESCFPVQYIMHIQSISIYNYVGAIGRLIGGKRMLWFRNAVTVASASTATGNAQWFTSSC